MNGTIKKVLMTADTVGGVWTYAIELIRALAPHGVEVLLATMGRPLSSAQWDDLEGMANVTIAESRYRLEWMDDPWGDVAAAGEWLLALEQEFGPEIVHLNSYAHGALPWLAPTVVVGHSCVLSWWSAVKRAKVPDSWRTYRAEVQAGLHAAELVIAPSGAMLNCLLEHYGVLASTRVIPNGRTLELFRPLPKEDFIFTAGRLWDEAKNVRAACACASNLPWPISLAGETEMSSSGAASPDLCFANVRCLGSLSSCQVIDTMGRASIYAHPAKYEPFGLSILEAALSGCALVLGDVPSLRENWSGAAIFIDPHDEGELRDALLGLIHKPALRAELGRAARERARQFDIRFTAMRYIEAYESLVMPRANHTRREECLAV